MDCLRLAAALLVFTSAAIAACGSSGGSGTTGTTSSPSGTGGASGTSSNGGANASGTGGTLFDAGVGPGGGGVGGAVGSYLIYASTDTDLYTLDPKDPSLTLTAVGTFDCIDPVNGPHTAMVDIAVDKSDALFGVTGHAVVPLTIQGTTVHCGTEISLNSAQPGQTVPTFYALTFAPVGVLDATKEVLVGGNSAGELWSIDTGAATAKVIGNFGIVPADDGHGHAYANAGKAWELS